MTASLDSCAEIEYPFSDVIKSGRVWRKVPESDARCVVLQLKKRQPSLSLPSVFFHRKVPTIFAAVKKEKLSLRNKRSVHFTPGQNIAAAVNSPTVIEE